MFRSSASRAAFQALNHSTPLTLRSSLLVPRNAIKFNTRLSTLSRTTRPMALAKPLSMALTRYQTNRGAMDNIDSKHEQQVGQEKLEAHPETVSATSSTHPIFGEVGTEEPEKDTDMMAGIRNDFVSRRSLYTYDCGSGH